MLCECLNYFITFKLFKIFMVRNIGKFSTTRCVQKKKESHKLLSSHGTIYVVYFSKLAEKLSLIWTNHEQRS